MADKIGYRGAIDGQGVPIPERFRDNGDNTYSPAASESAASKGTPTFSAAAPTNTAAAALSANANRKEALIVNNGTQTVYLGKDNSVTTNNGLPLAPGDALRDDRTTGAWWAIVASGTGDLRIVEVV